MLETLQNVLEEIASSPNPEYFESIIEEIRGELEDAKEAKPIIVIIQGGAVQHVDFQGHKAINVFFHDYDIQDAEQHIEEGTFDIRKDDEGDYYECLKWESDQA